jgi:hypothetical protein
MLLLPGSLGPSQSQLPNEFMDEFCSREQSARPVIHKFSSTKVAPRVHIRAPTPVALWDLIFCHFQDLDLALEYIFRFSQRPSFYQLHLPTSSWMNAVDESSQSKREKFTSIHPRS